MKSFLHRVADLFYELNGDRINRLAFVFPNRRSGVFFQKYLSEIAGKPIFSPAVLTINDLFEKLSGIKSADRLQMLFLLYKIYVEESKSEESFDEFLFWGEMLLNDFDDVDKYMADARKLFTNVSDLKELNDYTFLDEEQLEAIRSFWSVFPKQIENDSQQSFLNLWQVLYPIYEKFKQQLLEKGIGYDGMIFRSVVESLQKEEIFPLSYEKVVFVGLNALSHSEELFLLELKRLGVADFYWDYESPEVLDSMNKASYFANRNLKNFPSEHLLLDEPSVESEGVSKPEIEVLGIPSAIGEAKYVWTLLQNWFSKGEPADDTALRTAIVLPDETLLLPVLNSIPKDLRKINVTMGYPLSGTPVALLIEKIFTLYKHIRWSGGEEQYYYRSVLPLLNHQYVFKSNPQEIERLLAQIVKDNRVYVSAEELRVSPLLNLIFDSIDFGKRNYAEYLSAILIELAKQLEVLEEEDEPEGKELMSAMELEFIYHYYAVVNRMNEIIKKDSIEMKNETFIRLLSRLMETVTVPFEGEPLSGLQIMGVLETRALDFDRIVILSMNDGVFPKQKAPNSFIPYNLRRGFGLPTYEHQDSVWAYHFYRLIHRASEVKLLYDTRSGGMKTGEVSRFVHQLRYLYNRPLKEKLVVYDVIASDERKIEIVKDASVMQKLNRYREGGTEALSASALNTYLNCPLQFYFSKVERIGEEEEVLETVESNTFGSLLHKTMELVYENVRGRSLDGAWFNACRKAKGELKKCVQIAFQEEFFKSSKSVELTGRNYLIGEMILKYVDKILETDSKLTPFVYLASEEKIEYRFRFDDGAPIRLKGYIDRVDRVDGVVRIVDYKTGGNRKNLIFKEVNELFKTGKNRPKEAMQVLLYSMMYKALHPDEKVAPHVYFLRSLFESTKTALQQVDGTPIEVSDCMEEYEVALKELLNEIFNPEKTFGQTTDRSNTCLYCAFASICGRT